MSDTLRPTHIITLCRQGRCNVPISFVNGKDVNVRKKEASFRAITYIRDILHIGYATLGSWCFPLSPISRHRQHLSPSVIGLMGEGGLVDALDHGRLSHVYNHKVMHAKPRNGSVRYGFLVVYIHVCHYSLEIIPDTNEGIPLAPPPSQEISLESPEIDRSSVEKK